MPREVKIALALPITAVQVEMLAYVLESAATGELPARWAGAARRLKTALLSSDPDPKVRRILDVSTAHLTAPERQRLADGELLNQTMTGEYGGMVYVSELERPELLPGEPTTFESYMPRPPEISESLWMIVRHAHNRRCGYVLFDADAPELPGFRTFDDEPAP